MSDSGDGLVAWLIAVPTESSREATLARLAQQTSAKGLSQNSAFVLPELSVGTLDTLMSLSDGLGKMDENAESLVKRVARAYFDTLSDGSDDQKTQRGALQVDDQKVEKFVRDFRWDTARYPTKSSLDALANGIDDMRSKYENDLKKHTHKYSEVKQTLIAMERKENGSLVMRPLGGIVKNEHIVSGEFIQSVFVVVPTSNIEEFLNKYEALEEEVSDVEEKEIDGHSDDTNNARDNEFSHSPSSKRHSLQMKKTLPCRIVVPRSALEIYKDKTFALFRVVILKRGIERFTKAARIHRFTVREYEYNLDELQHLHKRRSKLEKERDFLWRNLVKWCSTTYSEVFKGWLHLKAIRIFVESVLRFGLPVNFTAVVLKVQKNCDRKLRLALSTLYSNLSGAHLSSTGNEEAADYSGIGGDFYSYVYFPLIT